MTLSPIKPLPPTTAMRMSESAKPVVGLGQGAREAGGVHQPRRAVGTRVDAEVQAVFVQHGEPHQLVAAPELRFVVVRLLGAGDDHLDRVHREAPWRRAANQASKSTEPMRASSPAVSSPPCSSVPK